MYIIFLIGNINLKYNGAFQPKMKRNKYYFIAFQLHVTPRIIVFKISLGIWRTRDVNEMKCIPSLSKSNSFRN